MKPIMPTRIIAMITIAALTLFMGCEKEKEKDDDTSLTITSFVPTQASAGETLTINGRNFSTVADENNVTINGIVVTVISATKTELKISVPKNLQCIGPIEVCVAEQTTVSTTNFSYLPTVTVSTLAGSTYGFADGIGTAAKFGGIVGIAVDAVGNIYVADGQGQRIRKITPEGVVSTLAGDGVYGFVDGIGTAARFRFPECITIDAMGNVYVADSGNHCIRKITPTGEVTTYAGSGTIGFADGVITEAKFSSPYGLTIDASGNMYVADSENNRIRKITPAGMVSTLAGIGTIGFADGIGTEAKFFTPIDVVVDAAGNLYVADYNNHRIRKITPAGVVSTLAGSGAPGFRDGTGTLANFNVPASVAMDTAGNLYVADSRNHCIRMITPAGMVSTLAGNSIPGFVDGTGAVAKFNTPVGVTVDANGNLYVTDFENYRIRKMVIE